MLASQRFKASLSNGSFPSSTEKKKKKKNRTYDVQRSSIRKHCSAVQKLPFCELSLSEYKKDHISAVVRTIDSKFATKVHRTMHIKRNTVLTLRTTYPGPSQKKGEGLVSDSALGKINTFPSAESDTRPSPFFWEGPGYVVRTLPVRTLPVPTAGPDYGA